MEINFISTENPYQGEIEYWKEKIQKSIKYNYDKKKFYNFSVVIFNKNEILYNYFMNSNFKKEFETGSLTKLITATLTQILFQSKFLKPEDKVIDFFPIYFSQLMDKITIQSLLTHTAGLPDLRYYKTPKFIKYSEFDFLIPYAIYPPNEHYRYSNQGYMILGKILEKICKKPISECAKEYIYNPLGMDNSAGPKNGASGFKTTLFDLVKFGQMYLNYGSLDKKSILDINSILEMLLPNFSIPECDSNFYTGRGWRIKYNKKMFTMFHIGGDNYISAWLQLFPFEGFGLAYLGTPPSYDDELMSFLTFMQLSLAKLSSLYAKKDDSMIFWLPCETKPDLFEQFIGKFKEIHTDEIFEIKKNKDQQLLLVSNRGYSYFLRKETHHIFTGGPYNLTHHFIFDPNTKKIKSIANGFGYSIKME